MTAPQIFQESDSPRYRKGFIAHFCLYGLFNVVLAVLRILLVRRNRAKRGDAAETQSAGAKTASDEKIEHVHAFQDLTDQENPDFRYDI